MHVTYSACDLLGSHSPKVSPCLHNNQGANTGDTNGRCRRRAHDRVDDAAAMRIVLEWHVICWAFDMLESCQPALEDCMSIIVKRLYPSRNCATCNICQVVTQSHENSIACTWAS